MEDPCDNSLIKHGRIHIEQINRGDKMSNRGPLPFRSLLEWRSVRIMIRDTPDI